MKTPRRFPKGSTFQNWTRYTEMQKGTPRTVIRRWVTLPDGKKINERLPSIHFKAFLNKPDELEKLVIRLNGAVPEEQRCRQKVIFNHAYIDPAMMDQYKDAVSARLPSAQGLSKEFGYLTRYFLNFFIGRMGLSSPLEWHLNQPMWAWALLNRFPKDRKEDALKYRVWKTADHIPSEKTLREIVGAANRFMAWLHQRRPLDAKPLVFDPISRAQFKDLTATRKRLDLEDNGVFVSDKDWAIIEKNLPDQLEPFAKLAYYYGLRRAETLGILPEHLMEDHLQCMQQLNGINRGQKEGPGCKSGTARYANLKGKLARKIPHWFMTPEVSYEVIAQIFKKKLLLHPDGLSGEWAEFMDALGMDYGLHDLRHTFITKAAMRPGASGGEVMLAAGHQNIETTMKYFHDSRNLSEKRFVPKSKLGAA